MIASHVLTCIIHGLMAAMIWRQLSHLRALQACSLSGWTPLNLPNEKSFWICFIYAPDLQRDTVITIISPCSLLSLAIFPVSFIRSIFSQGSILNSITLVLLCPSIFVNVLFRKSSKRLQKPPQFDIKSLFVPHQTQINKSKFINLQNTNPQIPVKSCSLSPTCARDQMFPSSSADRSNLPRVACR